MSDAAPHPDLVLWPRDALVAAVPARAPAHRHEALAGLAGFDWRLRRGWRRRREEVFLRRVIEGGAEVVVPRPGDLTLGRVHAAFAAAQAAAGEAAAGVTPLQVLALLRGNYLALASERRAPAVALAAAVAVRCGIAVHVACASREGAEALLPLVRAAVAEVAPVQALAEAAEDRPVLAATGVAAVVGTAAALAHAWLRWGGEQDALARAAAILGTDAAPCFSYAPLLLCAEGDVLLLDMLRHPLQLTSTRVDDAARFMHQVAGVVAGFSDGQELADGALAPAGEAVLARMAMQAGGLWAVPGLRRRYADAVLRARSLQPDQDFVMAGGRLQWKADPLLLAGGDPAAAAALELALRCLQGEPPAQRIRRRAWFADFFAGYARIGATGPALAGEAADLWWLHGLPVLGNHAPALAVEWSAQPLAQLAAMPGAVAATRVQAAAPGVPPALPCLETADGQRQAAAALAEGQPLRVLGLPVTARQLPSGVSSIMLACDDPQLPPWLAAITPRLPSLGPLAPVLGRLLGRWLLARAARQRFRAREALALRGRQERRTYAFAGEARET